MGLGWRPPGERDGHRGHPALSKGVPGRHVFQRTRNCRPGATSHMSRAVHRAGACTPRPVRLSARADCHLNAHIGSLKNFRAPVSRLLLLPHLCYNSGAPIPLWRPFAPHQVQTRRAPAAGREVPEGL